MEDAAPVPPMLVTKYNRFVDSILGRINKILGRSYDPVNVHLATFDPKHNRGKNRKRDGVSRRSQGEVVLEAVSEASTNSSEPEENTIKPVEGLIPEAESRKQTEVGKRTKHKDEQTKTASPRPGPKATLYGLSSIKRSGNVKVNPMVDYTSVKSNFILGPLVLKVEKQFGRGTKRELRLATATTQEMIGRITLRVVNGAATLHSIKVQQPRQVAKRMFFRIGNRMLSNLLNRTIS